MSKQRIRVGLVGYGLAGRVFHVPLIQAVPSFEIVAISSSRKEEIAKLGSSIRSVPAPEDIFQDPTIDLVVIASPSSTHGTLAAAALRCGKHVVVDKPFAMNLTEANDLIALADQVQRQLFVFHNRRWDSDFLSIRSAIEEGLLGRVVHFESHLDRFRPHVQDRWREDGLLGSGIWYDLGPHLVDQAILLFGRPVSVLADIAILRDGGRSDDFVHVILQYEGRRVILQANLNAPNGLSGGFPRFAVYGKQGALIKQGPDQQEPQLISGIRPGDPSFGVDSDPLRFFNEEGVEDKRDASVGCQQRYYELVAEVLLNANEEGIKKEGPISHNEMLWVQEVIEAAQISSKEGRVVSLPLSL